ncbi:MAG: hypothetical protein SFU83_05295 [Meiothermus sp.]|nr:hypothetical protein [Meiothermus sp.]
MKRTLSLLVGAVALLGVAFAQQTPAGTNISNQASATYIDSAGQNQSTTSNQVLTVVQQVYSFTITPNSASTSEPTGAAGFAQSRSALPGARVYFPYTVNNTGNGPDTINLTSVLGTAGGTTPVRFVLQTPTIYRDTNCNGSVDAGESVISSVALTQNVGALAATSLACVIIETTIPSSANNNEVGNINLSGISAGNNSVTDTNNWSRAIATTSAALDINKSASPSNTASAGGTISYTITGQNRGGSAASGLTTIPTGLGSIPVASSTGILIWDIVPTGLTLTGAPSGSSGAGTVNIVYSSDGTTWTSTAPTFATWAGDGTRRVGMWITGSGAFFPQGASYTFSFTTNVPAGAASGTTYTNTANLQFNNGADVGPVASNSTSNTVGTTFGVALGPNGTATAAGNGAVGSADSQTIASAFSGQTVTFTQTLQNTGNASDSFNLSLGTGATAPNLAPPSGWSCQITQIDGTPINTAVGPFAANATFNFQVRCAIPASYTTATAVSLNVIATSVGNSGTSDPTADTVSAVSLGYAVDLATRGNTSRPETAANDNPAGQTTNPATTVSFPLDVRNNGENTDTYQLSATIPSGWSVQFINDANNNGVADSGEAVVNNTGLMAKDAVRSVIAVVTVPAGTSPGSNSLTFTTTSATLGTVSNAVSTTITVNEVRAFVFDPDRSGTVTSPGTIVYTHNLRNNGNASATVAIPAPTFLNTSRGWTYQYSTDGGTTWTSTVSGLVLAANASATLQVRVIVPAGEAIGVSETAQITATATYASSATAAQTVNDTTTIVAGDLTLAKTGISYVGSSATVRSATAATALPGDQILYTVVATNNGVGNLTTVKIADPLPSFTDFVSVSATTTISGGTVVYSTDGNNWTTTAPTTLSAGQSIYVAVNTAGTAGGAGSIDASDLMAPGRTITITFRVQVR